MKWLSRGLWAGLLITPSVMAADITLSKTLAGPALSLRGQWVTTQPLVFRVSPEGTVLQTRWFYRLNGPVPGGFEARLCKGKVCVSLNSGQGSTGFFTDSPVSGAYRFSFRILSGEAIRPQLRVISAGVTVSYRQLSAAGHRAAPEKNGAASGLTYDQRF